MNRYLIVNADDFGLSHGTNVAIEDAHKTGILTSASIMPAGPAFTDAARRAKANPELGIGIHISLNWGKSILPKDEIPDLVDREGYFYPSVVGLYIKCLFNHAIGYQIRREIIAQIARVKRTGLAIDHIDSQFHIHFFPTIFPILTSIAQKESIPFVRVPIEPIIVLPFSINMIKWLTLNFFGLCLKIRHNLPHHFVTFFGVLQTGSMTSSVVQCILERTHEEVIEILSHPGTYDLGKGSFDFRRQYIDSFLRDPHRNLELYALRQKSLRHVIKEKKWKLARFKDIPGA